MCDCFWSVVAAVALGDFILAVAMSHHDQLSDFAGEQKEKRDRE